jgi:hypothetical protein
MVIETPKGDDLHEDVENLDLLKSLSRPDDATAARMTGRSHASHASRR